MIAAGRAIICSRCSRRGHNRLTCPGRDGNGRELLGSSVPPGTMKRLIDPSEKSTRGARPARDPFPDLASVPARCPVPGCDGLWRWIETGVSCLTAGHAFVVESVLRESTRRRPS